MGSAARTGRRAMGRGAVTGAVLAALLATTALAEPVYIQIEAKRTETEAAARAADWATKFPNLVGHKVKGGWLAMAIGPLDRAEAEVTMKALKAEGAIPADSYIVTGKDYREPFWPAALGGAAAAVPGAAASPAPSAAPTAPAATSSAPAIVVTPLAPPPTVAAPPAPPPGAAAGAMNTVPPAELPTNPGQAAAAPATPAPAVVAEPTPAERLKAARAAEKALPVEVRQDIQRALEWAGVYKGRVDGDFGGATRTAVTAWQKAQGLPETGVLEPDQQARLMGDWQAGLAALGLTPLTDPAPGMKLLIPSGLVAFDKVAPPFAIYRSKDRSGVELYLISRPGEAKDLAALADLVGALNVLPEGAARKVTKKGFSIDGESGSILTHAEARLDDGKIRGFVLVWPVADRDRQARVLTIMQESFRPKGDSTLDPAGDTPLTEPPEAMVSGLGGAKPRATGSGFFVEATGGVLTAEVLTRSCRRLTIDGIPARQLAADEAMNLAFLRPERVMAPGAVAALAPEDALPARAAPIAVAGFSWPGTLPAAILTKGEVTAERDAAGEPTLATALAPVQPGDIGGPVLTGAGAVAGLLLPVPQDAQRIYPPDFAPYRLSPALAAFLSGAGVTPVRPDPDAKPMSAEALARLGRDLTVEIACY